MYGASIANIPNLPTIELAAVGDLDHRINGILLGEVTDPDRPRCWVVLLNDPGWFDTAAATGPVILLNQGMWVQVR